jgi:hypothetical protein
MCVDGGQPEPEAVIMASPERLRKLWSKRPTLDEIGELARGNEQVWRADRKFSDAEQAMHCNDRASAVPIPKVGLAHSLRMGLGRIFGQIEHVDVSDVTRTIWLLANGAEFIPIRCWLSGAARLAQRVGMIKDEYRALAELIGSSERPRDGESRFTGVR